MLLIRCPYCGKRPELEFHCGGEAHIARPETPASLNDEDWASHLYYRTNPKGLHAERWQHTHGCHRWFNVLRDTVSDAIVESYEIGTPRPAVDASTTGAKATTGDPGRGDASSSSSRPAA